MENKAWHLMFDSNGLMRFGSSRGRALAALSLIDLIKAIDCLTMSIFKLGDLIGSGGYVSC